MIAASGLSGDTLVACRFPVVQLPTWQLPVQALCSAAKRPGRLCPAGLTRAVSLPERDSLSREHAFAGGRRPVWSSYSSLNEERAEEEGASDSSGRYDSTSSPEEAASRPRREAGESSEARGALRLHNSFLPNVELDEDEEDEDGDGDNLHRYYEDSSFVLHGNSNWPLCGDVDGGWGPEGIAWGGERERRWLGEQPDPPDPPQRCRGDQASDALKDTRGCSPELLNGHADYVSDSSCNSSDGVLVNFCAMYNRSNNPATPLDLSGPALHPGSPEGSVFLNLRPVPRSPVADQAPRWSPRGLDSNCNLCSLEPPSPGLSSLEASDLNACLRGPASLAMGTNQKYYKLVTCDLSSQSPSPAWSSLSSGAEGPSRCNEHRKSLGRHKESNQDRADQQEDQTLSNCSSFQLIDHQVPGCRKEPSDHMRELQCSPQNPGASASTATVNLREGEETRNGAVVRHLPEGACSSGDESMRRSRAQRPTSLPIQPFVLVPAGEPRAQRLGGLLEQYMSQKSGSESGLKFRDKSSRRASDPQPSPGGARCPVLLEAPSSSDSCSTCTPSPSEYLVGTWTQSVRGQGHTTQWTSRTSPFSGKRDRFLHVPSDLSKTPTYQDLLVERSHSITTQPQTYTYDPVFSHTPPTLPLTAEAHYPNLQVCFPPTSSQPEARFTDCGFSHSPFTAALSSAPPLSSLSSLLSSAAPGPHPPRTQDSAEPRGGRSQRGQRLMPSDGPPADFCLSPDASYESMSISHLQRRGLLRSVSRAVDLVMAHFGSSRDPEEKMRLGNSSWSPTIAGLVLEHLCPAIQNILEDGLRDHKLDLIIGQRRNHSWSVVEVSTRIGPSTRVLHSLVSKVRQCPQLTTHCMRLRAFVMGLLNLRALEFWLSHLQGQEDVVSAYYHSWGFLSMSLGRCRPMFQELLLLLQPLSVLPFDLNLLLEPRLLRGRRLRPEVLGVSPPPPPPPPCSALLATSWPLLQADSQRGPRGAGLQQMGLQCWETLSPLSLNCIKQRRGGARAHRSPCPSTVPEWRPAQDPFVEGAENCNQVYAGDWSQISMESRWEERGGFEASPVQAASPHQGALRWAKLFGATDGSTRAEAASQNHARAQTRRRPSQWLHLDRSQLGQLAQSIRTMKLAAQMDKRKHY